MIRKNKLIEARHKRGYSQECMAVFLAMDTSSYGRKENGKIKIYEREWEKISEILKIPLEDVYESDENLLVIINDNVSGFDNTIETHFSNYFIPQSMWECQKKYIEKLEQENRRLKEEIQRYKCNSSC